MLEKYYTKIARPLALIFACFSVIVIIDYFMPRDTYIGTIQDIKVHGPSHPRYKTISYSIKLGNQKIRIDDETFVNLNVGDKVEVYKTKILKKITRLKDVSLNERRINIYVVPFTYFPLYPLLFLLPLIFVFIQGDSILLMTSRPLSLGLALISLLMVLF